MPRQISALGLKMIEGFEGLYLHAYHGAADRPGLWTIGYGHTSAAGAPVVTPGLVITKEQADDILRSDLTGVELDVERLVKVPLNENQYAALLSFTFNLGGTALEHSTLLRRLNAGDYNAVPIELMKWVHSNGHLVDGLVTRRQKEGAMFMGLPYAPSSNTIEVDDPDALAKAVQAKLNELGYGPLVVDGDIGKKSLTAITHALEKTPHA